MSLTPFSIAKMATWGQDYDQVLWSVLSQLLSWAILVSFCLSSILLFPLEFLPYISLFLRNKNSR